MNPEAQHSALPAVHIALCAVMTWLSLALSASGDTFATSVSCRLMACIAPEPFWAVLFWAAASIGALGLVVPSRPLRLLCVLLLASAHATVALCFALSNPLTTGSGTYAVLAGLGYHLAWRQSDD